MAIFKLYLIFIYQLVGCLFHHSAGDTAWARHFLSSTGSFHFMYGGISAGWLLDASWKPVWKAQRPIRAGTRKGEKSTDMVQLTEHVPKNFWAAECGFGCNVTAFLRRFLHFRLCRWGFCLDADRPPVKRLLRKPLKPLAPKRLSMLAELQLFSACSDSAPRIQKTHTQKRLMSC